MKIGLGTVQFGMAYGINNSDKPCDDVMLRSILQFAANNGIVLVDTAPSYGNAEARLGKTKMMNKFNVVTKINDLPEDMPFDDAVAMGVLMASASLTDLGLDAVYSVICHNPAAMTTPVGEKTRDVLGALKADGLLKKMGVSIYHLDDVDRILADGNIDLVQLPLNLLDQRYLRSGALRKLHNAGIEIHVRSAFLQGLLLMPLNDIKTKKPEAYAHVKRVHDAAMELNITPLELTLGFLAGIKEIDTVLVGVTTVEQLSEIHTATTVVLPKTPDYADLFVDDMQIIDPRNWG